MQAPEEFQWLFAQEYVPVVCAANVVLHDYARAEEVAQDAFVRLLEHWPKVSKYERPGAWVRKVAIRLAIKVATREARIVSLEDGWPETCDAGPMDLDLLRAIQDLSPRQRAIVTLYYLEDWPAAEIAGAVGCSAATVSVHLHRARVRLAELLGEEVESDVG